MEQQTGSKLGKEYVKAVYCHSAYLTYMQSESKSEVAQSCPTLCDPVDCSPPGSFVHGILQARILGWVAISGLDEAQAGIKIAGRNINNVRYADDTTLLSSSQILTPSEQLLSSRDAVSVTSNRAILAC